MNNKIRENNRDKHKRKNNIRNIILEHLYKNIKSYILVIIIFIIGVTLGVIFINNANETQLTEIKEYITNFIDSLKEGYHIDRIELLQKSILDNLILIISMWFIGSTVIGLPIVFGIVIYRSFCIGYTISAAISVLRSTKRDYFYSFYNLFTKFDIYSSDNLYDN